MADIHNIASTGLSEASMWNCTNLYMYSKPLPTFYYSPLFNEKPVTYSGRSVLVPLGFVRG